jgi:hypothetical protein
VDCINNISTTDTLIQTNNKMETTIQTPQERKEAYIQSLQKKIEDLFLDGSLTNKFMTCSSAPSYGWSVEEYMYMPSVASRLRTKGYSVTSSVNWGVTDWIIAL